MLHFAGGNVYSYKSIQDLLKEKYDVVVLELPGRGNRMDEELLIDMKDVTEDIYSQILPYAMDKDSNYVIYGHSMGGLVGYLTSVMLEENEIPLPKHLIVSGSKAPSVKTKVMKHNLPLQEFKEHLRAYNGTPSEIIENDDFFEFYEPILRADFQVIEKHNLDKKYKLNIPIVAFRGEDENFSKKDFEKWKKFSNKSVKTHYCNGNHFFIFKHKYNFVEKIIDEAIY